MPRTIALETADPPISRPSWRRWLSIAFLAGAIIPYTEIRSQAEEPAQKFVEQLRSQGFHDLAIRYLERIDEFPGVNAAFKDALQLELAQVKLEAGQKSRVIDQRDAYYSEASDALQTFIRDQPSSPRRAEARLQLGNLQLLRGAQLMELGGEPDDARRQKAKAAFLGAAQTFSEIVADLRSVLEGMQGQKIDATKEPEKIALRDRYRSEYLQALLLGGDATKRAADTFVDATPERQQLYADALNRFVELRDKHDDTLAGILATLYAAQVQQSTGNTEAATASYLAVLDQPNNDVLRSPKIKAVIGLMRLFMSVTPPNYQEAVNRGQPWADDIRPAEKREMDFCELRMVLAEAYLGLADTTEAPGDKRKSTGIARELLLAVSKISSPFQDAAGKQLAALGVNVGQSAALERAATMPKTFAEAMSLVDEILEEEKSLTLTAQLIDQRVEQGEKLTDEQTKARQSLNDLRVRGIDILRHALTLNDKEIDSDAITQARASLAFLLFRAERFREAAVVGEFIARRYPSSELALSSGLTALGSWQYALRDADEARTPAVLDQLQRVADYLVTQWPNDPQAASARELLVRVAIGRNDFDAAKRYLTDLPNDNVSKNELQRAMGRLMWNQSIKLQTEGDTEAAMAIRSEAAATLQAGLNSLTTETVDAASLEGALLLARIQMLGDQSIDALATLDSDIYGPLKRIDQIEVPSAEFKGEVYGLALQAIVGQLTNSGGNDQGLMQRATTVMAGLQQAYKDQPEGEQKLVGTYFRLARDIRTQLESAPVDKKQRLTDAFQLFLNQLAQNTDDSKTLHWVAQTMLGLGQSQMGPSDVKATGQAEALIKSASELLQKIATRGAKEPSWLVGESMLTQVRLELGTAARLVGDYKTALDSLTDVLAVNAN